MKIGLKNHALHADGSTVKGLRARSIRDMHDKINYERVNKIKSNDYFFKRGLFLTQDLLQINISISISCLEDSKNTL